jgi:hypothetical protein
VLVVVAVRDAPFEGALVDPPAGRWRDLLRGDERSFSSRIPLSHVVSEHGLAVFERLSPALA